MPHNDAFRRVESITSVSKETLHNNGEDRHGLYRIQDARTGIRGQSIHKRPAN
jgi:hypothetical protein